MVKEIKVVTKTTCAPCRALKAFLNYKHIGYNEVSMDDDNQQGLELLQQFGYAMVPLTIVTLADGREQAVAGYNPSALINLLENPVPVS